jgi:RNA 2',3'-cyclic 3'-phosphodiesterase
MRLFVGLELPKEIKNELFKIQKSIPNNLVKVKWVAKKNLHLTLKFLGEIDKEEIEEIKNRLNKIKFKPFEVKLTKFGFFSNSGNVRVLFAELFPKKNIINLQQKIDGELLSLFKNDQKFNPNLTLGRVKAVKKKNEFLACLEKTKIKPLSFSVKEFYLIESKLTKEGPQYKPLFLYS